jgi:hypothetical protein
VNKETNTKEQELMQNDKGVERNRSEVEAKQETSAAKKNALIVLDVATMRF